MDPYLYFRDFQITKQQYNDCIEKIAEESGKTIEYTTKALSKFLTNIQETCIGEAAEAGKPLKDYQALAVKHMLTHRGMIAAFDVGTGKTLTAVAVSKCLLYIAEFLNKNLQVVVVTPTSLQENFKRELRGYGIDPEPPRYLFYTTELFAKAVASGDLDCNNKLIIIDESHVFRTDYRSIFTTGPSIAKVNTRAEYAIACASRAWKVLLLTATPIYNRTHDLVNLISMVKGLYPPIDVNPLDLAITNPEEFRKQYCDAILFQKSGVANFPAREDILYKIQMEGEYEDEYRALKKAIKEGAHFQGAEAKNAFMTKVRTASNNISTCVKCDAAMEIIDNALKADERVLLFSEFKSSGVNLIIDRLKAEDIGYYLIDGATPKRFRQEYVNEFNSKKGNKVIIITRAGGEGLDLKKVMHVILFEKGWNISGQEQVVGRAIRYKSHAGLPKAKQLVKVWHLLTILPEEFHLTNDLPGLENYQTYELKTKEVPVAKDVDVVFVPITKATSILKNKGGIEIPVELQFNFLESFNNKKYKSAVESLLKKYGISYADDLTSGIQSADLYMFKQALEKDAANRELADALREIQIGVVECDIE